MIYPIVIYGNPVLKKVAADIDKDYPELPALVNDMYRTLDKAEGVGLAAPQIGLSIRLFIVDLHLLADDDPSFASFRKTFINARIVEYSEDTDVMEEGCLSIPGISESVRRSTTIKINYFDENWVEHTETFSGFAARAIQHEYDHIDGHVFTDKITLIRRQLIMSKLNAMAKGKVSCRYKYRN